MHRHTHSRTDNRTTFTAQYRRRKEAEEKEEEYERRAALSVVSHPFQRAVNPGQPRDSNKDGDLGALSDSNLKHTVGLQSPTIMWLTFPPARTKVGA
jgi:hypothetical protein